MPGESPRAYVIAGVGGLVVALALTTAWTVANRPAPSAAARPAVPAFSLPRLTGGTVRLAALRGKVVVIDFWATWCPPCRAELPWLVRLAQRLDSKGVVLVAISEDDPPGQVPLVTEFARQVPGLERFAVLGDPEIEARYGVISLPTLFIVDRRGRLVASFVGAADEARVSAFVSDLAAE
ncbi:MAG: hypothetical protein AMXMBFR34_53840 [Myxococcaceae bacterium]